MDAKSSITVSFLKCNVIVSRRATSGSEKKCEREKGKIASGSGKNISERKHITKSNVFFRLYFFHSRLQFFHFLSHF